MDTSLINNLSMDICCETEILYSALDFAKTLNPEGLGSISLVDDIRGSHHWKDLIALDNVDIGTPQCKLPTSGTPDNDKPTGGQKIMKTLKHAILEIVNGVDFEHTRFEQDHWKYQVVSILFTLALRDDLNTVTVESQEFVESLECFPGLSLHLAFELVKECGLELAFVEFLQAVDAEIMLLLFSEMADYLEKIAVSSCSSVGFHNLLFYTVGHLLLHKNGLLVTPLGEDNLEKVCSLVTKLANVMKSFVQESIQSIESLKQGEIHKYLAPGIVGLVNFASLLHSGLFVSYDLFSMEQSRMDIFTWPDAETKECRKHSKPNYLDVLTKYKLNTITDDELIQRVFEDDMIECLQVTSIAVSPDCSSDVLRSIVASLKELLLLEPVTTVLDRELGFAKDVRNVIHSSKAHWSCSCVNRLVLKKIFEQLLQCEISVSEKMGSCPNTDSQHCCGLYELMDDPTLMQVTREVDLSQSQQVEKSLFVVGEKLHGFEKCFSWILSVVHSEPCILNEALLDCFMANVDMLKDYGSVCKILDICMYLSDSMPHRHCEGSNIAIPIRNLLIDIFERVSVVVQCEILCMFYTKVSNPQTFFEVAHDKMLATTTSLLNKLVDTDQNASSDFLLQQFAVLALQNPTTLVTEVVQSAVRNPRHVEILGRCLQTFTPVSRFTQIGMNETFLCSCLGQMLGKADSLTDKETDNLISFVKYLIDPKEGNHMTNMKDSAGGVLYDLNLLISNHVLPLMLHSCSDITAAMQSAHWSTALKLLNCILKLLSENNQDINMDVTRESRYDKPIVLLGVLCCMLNDVCTISDASRGSGLLESKSLLITSLELLSNMIIKTINHDKVHEILLMLLQKISQQTDWSVMCFLQPIVKCMNEMVSTTKAVEDKELAPGTRTLKIHVPRCIADVVTLKAQECIVCDIESHSTSSTNTLLYFLKVISVSDSVCQTFCTNIRQSFAIMEKSEMIVSLAVLLPVSLPVEWRRVEGALIRLVQNGNLKFEDSRTLDIKETVKPPNNETNVKQSHLLDSENRSPVPTFGSKSNALVQSCVYEYILDAVLLVIALNQVDGVQTGSGISFEGIIKGLQYIYTQDGLRAVKSTARHEEHDCFVTHLYKVCLVISRVSEIHQDQLMTILLDLLDIMDKDYMMTRDNKEMVTKALKPLPPHVMDIVAKKIVCV